MAADKLQYSAGNSASTTLSSGVTNSDTSLPLVSDTNFNAKTGEGMVIVDEGEATEEIAYATTKTGGALTVPLANRGLEGGSAQAHSLGATVKGTLTAGMWNNLIDAVTNVLLKTTGAVDTTKVHGVDAPILTKQTTTPANPASGYNKLYFKSDDKIYKLNSAGVEAELGSGGTSAETFIIPGTLATGTDLAKTWYLPFNCKITSATAYVKTAGTTNSTVFDINLDGTTIFTDKPTIVSGGTSDSANADNPTTTRTAGSKITIDIDSVSTTAPVEAYIVLFYERV